MLNSKDPISQQRINIIARLDSQEQDVGVDSTQLILDMGDRVTVSTDQITLACRFTRIPNMGNLRNLWAIYFKT